MARKENRGPAPDLSFIEKVRVYGEYDRDRLRDYFGRTSEDVEPLRWLVDQWGAERTLVTWFGEGWDEFAQGDPDGLPVFIVRFAPDREIPQSERAKVGREFRARFPDSIRRMSVLS